MQKSSRTFSLSVAVVAALALLVVLGGSESIQAQYLISTKAGFINRVEGKVYIERQENENGERGRASLGTQMKPGDLLITDQDSNAELLLNPGAYLRLGAQTEVRAITTAYDETRFELVKGSVMVEVGELQKGIIIELLTPAGLVAVNKIGLQRIDAVGGATTISVRQGEIYLGSREQVAAKSALKIKSGKFVRLTGQNTASLGAVPELAKIDKDARVDDLDAWSFGRGQALMAANGRVLQRTSLSNSMAFGWYFDPFFNCYTFIPGGGNFYSPYGFPFFNRYSSFRYAFPYGLPYYYYDNPGWYRNGGGFYGGGNSGGGGGGVVRPPSRIIAGTERTGIRREIEGRGLIVGGGDRGFSGRSSSGPSPGFTTAAPVSTGTVAAPSAPAGGTSSGSAPVNVGGRPGRP